MKTINIFLTGLLLTVVFAGQIHAQKQLLYKAKAEFNKDTIQYLKYNYTIRSAQYKDKTVGEILKELEYPILYVSGIYRSVPLDSCNRETQLAGLYLCIKQTGKKPNELHDYYIEIYFENPPAFDEYKEVSGVSGNNHRSAFSQKLYDFIKDLKVSNVSTNEYILKFSSQ